MELNKGDRQVALTYKTGTIKIEVPAANSQTRNVFAYGEGPDEDPFAKQPGPLSSTDWAELLQKRLVGRQKATRLQPAKPLRASGEEMV